MVDQYGDDIGREWPSGPESRRGCVYGLEGGADKGPGGRVEAGRHAPSTKSGFGRAHSLPLTLEGRNMG